MPSLPTPRRWSRRHQTRSRSVCIRPAQHRARSCRRSARGRRFCRGCPRRNLRGAPPADSGRGADSGADRSIAGRDVGRDQVGGAIIFPAFNEVLQAAVDPQRRRSGVRCVRRPGQGTRRGCGTAVGSVSAAANVVSHRLSPRPPTFVTPPASSLSATSSHQPKKPQPHQHRQTRGCLPCGRSARRRGQPTRSPARTHCARSRRRSAGGAERREERVRALARRSFPQGS